MKSIFILSVLIISLQTTVITNTIVAQVPAIKSPFSNGYEKGFKEGYCYNTKAIYCDPQVIPITPLPRINESDQYYQDGFNRGFQVGLDLQRVENGGGSISKSGISYSAIPKYKFNDYIPTLPTNAMVNVLMYKEELFKTRIQWVQSRIDGLTELAHALLDDDEFKEINKKIRDYFTSPKNKKELGDFADDWVINQISNALKSFEKEIYQKYKDELKEIEKTNQQSKFFKLLLTAYDSVYKNPALSLKLVEEAEALNFEHTSTYNIKTKAYTELRNFDLALYWVNKLISSNANDKSELRHAIISKAIFLGEFNKYSEALNLLNDPVFNDAEKLVQITVSINKIEIYYRMKDYKAALNLVDQTLSFISLSNSNLKNLKNEDLPRLKQIKAASLRELGEYQQALEVINTAIKEDNPTTYPGFYATKGKIYFALNNYQLAANEFIKNILLDDANAEPFYYLGLCYKNLKQKTKACENLQKAIRLGSKEALEDYPAICR